jgi:uncharacterized protein YaaN involved in tellurite resistance
MENVQTGIFPVENKSQDNNISEFKRRLRNDPEVIRLAQSINTKDQLQLLKLGEEPALQISKFADRMLALQKVSSMMESSELIKQLGKIMDKFDPQDFKNEAPGFFQKIFNSTEKMIEKMFGKYQSMGQEIDKVYIEIKKYEHEMIESTKVLEQLSEQNQKYFMEIQKYIVAMEIKLDELNSQQLPAAQKTAMSGDQMAGMELEAIKNAINLIEQRIYSHTMAGHVSFQTEPNIRQLQQGNTKLIGKINDAFITTIPIFKTSIIQAVQAKRQKLVADSMAELDRRTQEMLVRNAENIAQQGVDIARLAGSPTIKAETLEKTWQIIMKGIQDVQAIEGQIRQERQSGMEGLAKLQEQYKQIKSVS